MLLSFSAIKEPRNVKLLYDLLNISSTEINKAVLFVTKNTLVCETIEDAKIIAYETDAKHKANDVIMCICMRACYMYVYMWLCVLLHNKHRRIIF